MTLDLPAFLMQDITTKINGEEVFLNKVHYISGEETTNAEESYAGKSFSGILEQAKILSPRTENVFYFDNIIGAKAVKVLIIESFKNEKREVFNNLVDQVYSSVNEDKSEYVSKEETKIIIQKYYLKEKNKDVSDKMLMKIPDQDEINTIADYVIHNSVETKINKIERENKFQGLHIKSLRNGILNLAGKFKVKAIGGE